MRFEIVTIFPDFFAGIFQNGILRRALAEELVTVAVHDLRAFTHDRHRTVDDRPFGGGAGMVLKPEPLAEALTSLGIQPNSERVKGAGLSVKDTGLSVEGTGLSVEGTGLSVKDTGLSVKGSGLSVKGAGFSVKGTGFSVKGTGFSVKGTGFSVKGTGFSVTFSPYIDQSESTGALAPEGMGPHEESPTTQTCVILLSAQGRLFTQALARELAEVDRVVLICGRYEGVDERINDPIATWSCQSATTC